MVILNACSDNKPTSGETQADTSLKVAYVDNPDPGDSLCIYDIRRAKKDISDGKMVFTQSAGFLFGFMRYEDELKQLCKGHGLVFDFDMISCIVFEGQTQGCYGQYMDEIIRKKFGADFKARLHAQADSMFLVNAASNRRIVKSWDCDERPRLPTEQKRMTDYIPNITVMEVDIKPNGNQWPFFDLGFVIETDSTISNFYINNFAAEAEENEKYKEKLFSIAVEHVKSQYPLWVPGKIKGIPVRTDNNVRVFFTR